MPGIREIIRQAESLPIEERVFVIDSLLRTLNPPTAKIGGEWPEVAGRRLPSKKFDPAG